MTTENNDFNVCPAIKLSEYPLK